MIDVLPPEEAGTCVLRDRDLCRLGSADLPRALEDGEIRYRSGSIGGALPTIRPA